MSKNLSELSARKGLENNLFEQLANDQIDKKKIAEDFLIGQSSVTGTMSFYDFLKPDNQRKKIYLCNGSACLCAGTQQQLYQQINQYFSDEEIGHMTCLGRCHENAAFHYKGHNYSALSDKQINTVITNTKPQIYQDHYQHLGLQYNDLTGPEITYEEFCSALNMIIEKDSSLVLDDIKQSQLRGRGGAGFPLGFKLEAAMKEKAQQKFIICNADEGDPGAYSDRYLLEQQTLRVLFGMLVAGYIINAQYGILYIRAEYPEAITIVKEKIKQIEKALEKYDFNFSFKIISAQGAYICGEETALINSIEGQRPEVRTRPPFPTQQGFFNKPTIVNNVETLANLYTIAVKGLAYYQEQGTERSSGTKLMCLDSFFNSPGVYEVEMGTPLSVVFDQLGGGFKQEVKAVHIGGPLGGIVPFHMIQNLTVDFESFADHGFLLGHASVVCIPASFSMMSYLQHLFSFAAYESCGKCFPCRLGTKRGEELFDRALNQKDKIESALLMDLLDTLEQGSLCAHGGGIPLPIRNAMTYFQDELAPYFR